MKQILGLAAALLAFVPMVSRACDVLTRNGLPVGVASEAAIIIWDERTHTEHFIRTANFDTKAQDIAFLVPTPSVPKLTAAKIDAIELLASIALPRNAADAPKQDDKSAVIHSQTVGGYEATVLSTAHSKAIDAWLNHHGFPKSKATYNWLEPYVRKGWTITAFRLKAKQGAADLKPVCMTFHTEIPFYPYREPESKSPSKKGRTLAVYFLGDVQQNASMADKPWVGQVDWAASLDGPHADALVNVLPESGFLKRPFLTVFKDTSSPRIGTEEVYFFPVAQPLALTNTFRWYGFGIVCFWVLFGAYMLIRKQRIAPGRG